MIDRLASVNTTLNLVCTVIQNSLRNHVIHSSSSARRSSIVHTRKYPAFVLPVSATKTVQNLFPPCLPSTLIPRTRPNVCYALIRSRNDHHTFFRAFCTLTVLKFMTHLVHLILFLADVLSASLRPLILARSNLLRNEAGGRDFFHQCVRSVSVLCVQQVS